MRIGCTLLLASLLSASVVGAQELPEAARLRAMEERLRMLEDQLRGGSRPSTSTEPSTQPSASSLSLGHTTIEIALSIAVLAFGALLVALQVLVMLKQGRFWDDASMRITGLTLVITAGLFLIVAGYSQNQTAPMMGLLGTVAGYLLGKEAMRRLPGAERTTRDR